MIRGITYDKQLFKSNDFALMTKRFFNDNDGKVYGCNVSTNGNNVTIDTGWFVASGYYTNVSSQEIIPVNQNGTLVYEIDLSKTNTTQAFNQGSFKIITGIPQHDDLFNNGIIYQMAIANVTTNGTSATITSTIWGNIHADFQSQIDIISTNINNINTSLGTKQKIITSGTSNPSGGSNGDIYLKYS